MNMRNGVGGSRAIAMTKMLHEPEQKALKKKERRGESRFPYCRAFRYVATGEPRRSFSHRVVSGEILDLSNGGMKIRLKRRALLADGAVVVARIPLRNIKATVPTVAVVRWTKALDSGLLAGLRFVME